MTKVTEDLLSAPKLPHVPSTFTSTRPAAGHVRRFGTWTSSLLSLHVIHIFCFDEVPTEIQRYH